MSYGIRVKNPLPNPVRVEVIDDKTIIREAILDPGQNKFIVLEKPGTYDVRTTILNKDGQGSYDELGPAAWEVTEHQEVKAPEVKVPVFLKNTVVLAIPHEQKTAAYWHNIVIWRVTPGNLGELLAAEIEVREDVMWRLKIMKSGDGRFGGKVISLSAPTTFTGVTLTGGEVVKLQAKSMSPVAVTVSGRLSARETVIHETISPAKVETKPTEEEEEEPVRSLADMFDEMSKKEVKV